jgi:hypothetical protein
MMENFSHILKRLPIASGAYSSCGHFGGTSPFKVQVNFESILVSEYAPRYSHKWAMRDLRESRIVLKAHLRGSKNGF